MNSNTNEDEWECQKCHYYNLNLDTVCFVCATKRIIDEGSKWQIKRHNVLQNRMHKNFEQKWLTTTSMPPQPPTSEPRTSMSSNLTRATRTLVLDVKWDCQECNWTNDGQNNECITCSTPRRQARAQLNNLDSLSLETASSIKPIPSQQQASSSVVDSKKSKKSSKNKAPWTCVHCTYVNEDVNANVCEICGQ